MAAPNVEYRNMANLAKTASSARVFNVLLLTQQLQEKHPDGKFERFFHRPELNNAIILKSRLQGSELDLFDDSRFNATKLFLPFNIENLRDGGQNCFLGEAGIEDKLRENFGVVMTEGSKGDQMDLRLLTAIDALPALDPFLLKETVAVMGAKPDPDYFQISARDWEAIRNFVIAEFEPLASAAFAGSKDIKLRANQMADKMWEAKDMNVLKPILDALSIDEASAPQILFAWKGILYYKYMSQNLESRLQGMMIGLHRLQVFGTTGMEERKHIAAVRDDVLRRLRAELATVKHSLLRYEKSYHEEFIKERKAKAFKEFLESAQQLFAQLGASIGGISHATSFWEFRFKKNSVKGCTADEMAAMLQDFSSGLPS